MADVLLLNPKFPLGKQKWIIGGGSNRMYPPLDMAWICKILEKEKINFKLIDANINRYSFEQIESFLKEYDPKVVLLTSELYEQYRCFALRDERLSIHRRLIKLTKKILPKSKVILIGPHGTVLPNLIFQYSPDLDVIVRGEPEMISVELIKTLLKNKTLRKIDGISFKENNKIKHNKERQLLLELDKLSYPGYHVLEMDKYLFYRKKNSNVRSTILMSSRGCLFQCIYCFKKFMGNKFRTRSIKDIMKEIDLLYKQYKVEHISFYDDNFTTDKQRIIDLCRELKKRKYKLTWDAETRIEIVDEALIKLMAEAGCINILFGIESLIPAIQKTIKKFIDIKKINKVAKWCERYDVFPCMATQLGLPGDSWETIKRNLKVMKKLDIPIAPPLITTIYPTTQLYNAAKNAGFIQNDSFEDCIKASGLAMTKFKDRKEYFSALKYYHTKIARLNFKRNASSKNIIKKLERHGLKYVLMHGFRMLKKLFGVLGNE
ncbi:radical SAM protein [Candidatus Woesearchaeota archaeon]|nr:radical SAM protein [Candidatus Woesearchaeota archaeon]